MEMDTSFSRNLKIVTWVHVACIFMLFSSGWFRGCERKKTDLIIPMEFLVAVPSAVQAVKSDDIPVVVKKPADPVVSRPVDRPVKKPVKVSDKVVTRPGPVTPVQKPPSAEEIEKLLLKGAKPSDRTVIPPDDSLHLALVQQAFHDAWVQPSSVEAGNAVVEVEIRFAGDGSVISAQIKKNSGVEVMDRSVAKALGYVKRVSGLTPDFIARYKTVTISFRVE